MKNNLENILRQYKEKNKQRDERLKNHNENINNIEKERTHIEKELKTNEFVCDNFDTLYNRFDNEFINDIKISKEDKIFIGLLTSLQVARQLIFNNDRKNRLTKRFESSNIIEKKEVSLFGGVPYDGNQDKILDVKGANHRTFTLGHDPALGLIFGTLDILNETLTRSDFRVFKMKKGNKGYHYDETFDQTKVNIFTNFEYVYEVIKIKDKTGIQNLFKALAHQIMHSLSDLFTDKSLPIPFIMVLLNEEWNKNFSGNINDNNRINVADFTEKLAISLFIDFIIKVIYKIFIKIKYGEFNLINELKLEKVVMLANVFSSSINLFGITMLSLLKQNKQVCKFIDLAGIFKSMQMVIEYGNKKEEIKTKIMEVKFELVKLNMFNESTKELVLL